MAMKVRKTDRGFQRADFIDAAGAACAIQESSIFSIGFEGQQGASDGPYLWLGRNEGLHLDGKCYAHMHLTQARAAELLPLLLAFVETGRLS